MVVRGRPYVILNVQFRVAEAMKSYGKRIQRTNTACNQRSANSLPPCYGARLNRRFRLCGHRLRAFGVSDIEAYNLHCIERIAAMLWYSCGG